MKLYSREPIFSDDPLAGEKLAKKIAALEAEQELFRGINKLVRKDDRAGLTKLFESCGFKGNIQAKVTSLFEPDFCGRIGIPDYVLKNNNANIRRLKLRAGELAQGETS